MLFFRPMYLQGFDIHCCRCSFWNQCICNLLFFELADTFNPAYHVNCICILPFLKPEDASFANFASTSHIFDNVKMLPIKILHLQSPRIHYRRYCRSISFEFYLLHNLSQYITYQKIDIRNSSEYGVSVGDT